MVTAAMTLHQAHPAQVIQIIHVWGESRIAVVIAHLVVMIYFVMNPNLITPVTLKEQNVTSMRKGAATEQS